MKSFLAAASLAAVFLGVVAGEAKAGLCKWRCCKTATLHLKPYNAFSDNCLVPVDCGRKCGRLKHRRCCAGPHAFYSAHLSITQCDPCCDGFSDPCATLGGHAVGGPALGHAVGGPALGHDATTLPPGAIPLNGQPAVSSPAVPVLPNGPAPVPGLPNGPSAVPLLPNGPAPVPVQPNGPTAVPPQAPQPNRPPQPVQPQGYGPQAGLGYPPPMPYNGPAQPWAPALNHQFGYRMPPMAGPRPGLSPVNVPYYWNQ
jgi:hypothetical protein